MLTLTYAKIRAFNWPKVLFSALVNKKKKKNRSKRIAKKRRSFDIRKSAESFVKKIYYILAPEQKDIKFLNQQERMCHYKECFSLLMFRVGHGHVTGPQLAGLHVPKKSSFQVILFFC